MALTEESPAPRQPASSRRATSPSTQRIPPQDIEAEISVLGAVLLGGAEALDRVSLSADDFYRLAHGEIWKGMLALSGREEPIDIVTLQAEMEKRGKLEQIGGYLYLVQLADITPTISNVAYYAKIVRDKALLRRLIEVSSDVALRAYAAEDAGALAEEAESLILGANRQANTVSTMAPVQEIIPVIWDMVDERARRGSALRGVSTGLVGLDLLLSGLSPGLLYVLGARTAMGKTALACDIGANVALGRQGSEYFYEQGRPVLIFSTEMQREDLLLRMMCSMACIDSTTMNSGRLTSPEWERLRQASDQLWQAPMEIDDEGSLSIVQMASRIRRFKRKYGDAGLVIVDYVQRLKGDPSKHYAGLREATVDICIALKSMAKQFKVPILALSQVSRKVEERQDKRPQLGDLSESGQLEQEADAVLFIYRSAYYQRPEPGGPSQDTTAAQEAEIIVPKSRFGAPGVAKVSFIPAWTRFEDSKEDLPGGF